MSPAARGAQRFCPNCGSKVTKTAKFCPSCGEALQAPGEATEELAPAAPPSPTRKSAARTEKLPPPAPPPAPSEVRPPPPPPPPPPERDLSWPAWMGAGAAGVLVIATGLPWFGGFITGDSYDIPLALLFSDSAQGGFPLGVLFLLVAVAGLAVALIKPDHRALKIAFLSAGGAGTVFMLWFLVRVLTNLQGASLFDVFSFGAWLSLLASIGMLTAGVMLLRSAVRTPA
ncbi:MAG: zinc ribbon domain-containing protein [Actinomycetota bacterium]|nr:zinc ribbon domain-containing protein [Actinomycetota bacterium]